jgi:FkbM family methyltransferase
MKALIRSAALRLGYDIIKHVETPRSPFPVLDLVVGSRVATGQKPFVVQIGANDGVRADPVRSLILRYELSALLVEPIPDVFASLQANYAGQAGVRFEQCAIGEHDGRAPLYRVRPHPGHPDWLQGISSMNRDHLTSQKFDFHEFEKYVEEVTVPMLTVASLLEKHGISEVGLLQIDTEGFDCRIVESALRSGVHPGIINYEHIHVHAIQQAACKRLLLEHGYDFVDVGIDTLAVRRERATARVGESEGQSPSDQT